ncbi:MAG: DUF4268 domain-containing protein [Bacteroidales bacterium]|nr:DUF4268 domain-containing protein [Bacteroidales bacterium]
MYSKEEEKELRLGFWTEFDEFTTRKKKKLRKPVKWILNETGIKQLKLKFEFDENHASVGFDVETRNFDKRIDVFGKLERLKTKIETALGQPLIWELDYVLANQKSISRACLEMQEVSIYRKDDWPQVMEFFYKNMVKLEKVFLEFKDYLRYGE